MIIRPVCRQDLGLLSAIARESGPGFNSLIDDREFLANRIAQAENSFLEKPGLDDPVFLFVLEDSHTGDVIGTSGIYTNVGHQAPLYHFHHERTQRQSTTLGINQSLERLTLGRYLEGSTEIGSLFLRPDRRRPQAGKLLSKVRFLFMACHRDLFSSRVIAEMRGVSTADAYAPFWHWFEKNFTGIDFRRATELVGRGQAEAVARLIPDHPLYTRLLGRRAREVIGRVHADTRPARRILEQEGFAFRGHIDMLDGGPTLEAGIDQIASIGLTARYQVRERRSPAQSTGPIIVANNEKAGFRATVTTAYQLDTSEGTLAIAPEQMKALGLHAGDFVPCLPLAQPSRQASHQPDQFREISHGS